MKTEYQIMWPLESIKEIIEGLGLFPVFILFYLPRIGEALFKYLITLEKEKTKRLMIQRKKEKRKNV